MSSDVFLCRRLDSPIRPLPSKRRFTAGRPTFTLSFDFNNIVGSVLHFSVSLEFFCACDAIPCSLILTRKRTPKCGRFAQRRSITQSLNGPMTQSRKAVLERAVSGAPFARRGARASRFPGIPPISSDLAGERAAFFLRIKAVSQPFTFQSKGPAPVRPLGLGSYELSPRLT